MQHEAFGPSGSLVFAHYLPTHGLVGLIFVEGVRTTFGVCLADSHIRTFSVFRFDPDRTYTRNSVSGEGPAMNSDSFTDS